MQHTTIDQLKEACEMYALYAIFYNIIATFARKSIKIYKGCLNGIGRFRETSIEHVDW